MLRVEEISKKFGDFQAINNLSFEVNVGDVMGFLGPNGAGKTTSMRVITGYLKSDEGRVFIDNKDIESRLNFRAKVKACNVSDLVNVARKYLFNESKKSVIAGETYIDEIKDLNFKVKNI